MKYAIFLFALALFTMPLHASPTATISPERITEIEQIALFGYGTPRAVAYHPNGGQFAVATTAGIFLYESASPARPQMFLQGHTREVITITYSPDGATLVSGGGDDTIRIWDTSTGEHLQTIVSRGEGGVAITPTSIAYHPDGTQLAAVGGGGGGVLLIDAATGTTIRQLQNANGRRVIFSPDGTRIAMTTGSPNNDVILWDALSTEERPEPVAIFSGHTREGYGIAYTADGTRLITSAFDQSVRVWDTQTGAEVAQYTHNTPVNALAYDATTNRIAVGMGDGNIYLYDLATGVQTLLGQGRRFEAVIRMAFSPDGAQLLVASADNIRLWSVNNRSILLTFDNYTPVGAMQSVAVHPDGMRIAIGTSTFERVAQVWDVATQEIIGTLDGLTGIATGLAYTADGTRLAGVSSDSRKLVVWDVATSRVLFEVRDAHNFGINGVAYHPDGARLITTGADEYAHVWDANTGDKLFSLYMPNSFNRALHTAVFSPDGASILTGNRVSLVLWDARTGDTVLVIEDEATIQEIFSASFSPDGGRIVASVQDRTGGISSVRVYETRTGTELLYIPTIQRIDHVRFSPDGIFVVGSVSFTFSGQTTSLIFWDAIDGTEVHRTSGHTFNITDMTYSPDGRWIATSSQDGTTRLWGLPE